MDFPFFELDFFFDSSNFADFLAFGGGEEEVEELSLEDDPDAEDFSIRLPSEEFSELLSSELDCFFFGIFVTSEWRLSE